MADVDIEIVTDIEGLDELEEALRTARSGRLRGFSVGGNEGG